MLVIFHDIQAGDEWIILRWEGDSMVIKCTWSSLMYPDSYEEGDEIVSHKLNAKMFRKGKYPNKPNLDLVTELMF